MSLNGAGFGREGPAAGQGFKAAGLKVLVPGYPQWSWQQRARSLVLLGSYLVAAGTGLFAWGTPVGLVLLVFAYGTHVVSVTDAVRQTAFPGFGRWMPWFSASGGLGLGLYVPVLGLATLVAWPGVGIHGGLPEEGYLVNCRAYAQHPPRPDDWVWLQVAPWGRGRLARVVAASGQQVEWLNDQVRVDGQSLKSDPAQPLRRVPGEMSFTVPPGHALIAVTARGSGRWPRANPVLVPNAEIVGRAWARLYPIRERRLLP
jgi:hypothetical protein